jgi:hypothetical protein
MNVKYRTNTANKKAKQMQEEIVIQEGMVFIDVTR